MLTGAALLAAADRSQAEVQRQEGLHAPGGAVLDEGGVLLTRGRGRLPVTPNTAIRTGDIDAIELVGRAASFFGEQHAGYTLHLRLGDVDDDLVAAAEAQGPLHRVDSPAMVIGTRLDPPPPDRDVELRPVTDAAGAAAYAAVTDDAYQSLGWPPGGPAAVFESPDLLLQPAKSAVIAYVDGTPAAAAMMSVTDGLGLVSWVGTTVAARGRGLGRTVTVAVTNAGFDLGADTVWLAASDMGAPLYRALGFVEFARSRSFVLWPGLER